MASIDERVVSMQFDNKSFEQNAGTTLSTLDKLKSSLNFSGSQKGLDDLNASAKAFNLAGIATAVDEISGKFTAMGAVAFGVINNIVNRAVNAGVQLARSLSLEQTIAGFQEYQTNMNAIQTILSNTKADATTLEDVNKALDTLNQYSDQTIYNFGEMARNIGTFTAAGVDLDTSVTAIKGIANLAAISGSNSQQASIAMYQLSQALASGTVKLMDWNSVVNAGMGGEVFQKALFETGKALGTIKNTPIDMTFEEWTKAGNSFRGSLEQGWITSEVLTNTLQGFTGDLTDAQLEAMGYTKEQIVQIQEMGKTGKAAATEVKTLSQLISTVKESIGSGWSQSFRIIVGDFEEAKAMFTDFNNAIGSVTGASADARNALLQGWKDLGGRAKLIDTIKLSFSALAKIISTVKEAFYDIFPPVTSKTLYELTESLNNFVKRLVLSDGALESIKRAFSGVFAVLKIGTEIAKGIFGVLGDLFSRFSGVSDGSSGILGFLAGLGDNLVKLKEVLVDSGAIEAFFDRISEGAITVGDAVSEILGWLTTLKDALVSIFDGSQRDDIDAIGESTKNLEGRFSALKGILDDIGKVLFSFLDRIGLTRENLDRFGNFIKDTFGKIPQAIADVFSKADYSQVLDTVNTGLFGGLVLLIRNFISTGFGSSGLLGNLTQALDALTGKLKAMERDVQANALLKIAGALALLTLSIVVLAAIDSAALTKSMIAIAAGLGILVGGLKLLGTAVTTTGSGLRLTLAAAGLILISGALVVLAIALRIISSMSWGEIAKGLTAITALLIVLSGAVRLISGNAGGMITAGLGILAIAFAMNVLAGAVKLFSMMSWAEIGKGLAAIAAGLAIITLAVNLMPNGPGMVLKGVGLIAIAVALNILAGAVKLFATMDWAELGKGFAAVAGGLFIIAAAMRMMPNGANLVLQGAGLVLISIGLLAIAKAIKSISDLSWEELGRGLAGIAASLLILSATAKFMQQNGQGAIAIAIMAASLLTLSFALNIVASMSWGQLIKGLVGIAASFVIIGIASKFITASIPALLGFAASLLLIGAGFALFGLGVTLITTAFAVFVTTLAQGAKTIFDAVMLLLPLIPPVLEALALGIVKVIETIVKALPGIVVELGKTLIALIQLVIDAIPKLTEAFIALIRGGLEAVTTLAPEIIEAGFKLLIDFLTGIRDNITEVTNVVVDIIVEFFDALTDRVDEIVAAGLSFLATFLQGIADNIGLVVDAAGNVVTSFLEELTLKVDEIITAGKNLIISVITGIGDSSVEIAAVAAITIVRFITELGKWSLFLVHAGFQVLLTFLNGLADAIELYMPQIQQAGARIAFAIVDGMTFGLASKTLGFAESSRNFVLKGFNAITGVLGINSPSKLYMGVGESIAEGLSLSLDRDRTAENSSSDLANRVTSAFKDSLSKLPMAIEGLSDMTPTITPVLDLTSVAKDAARLNNIISSTSDINAAVSFDQASQIAATTEEGVSQSQDVAIPTVTEIKFEQNNYSPEALSAADIYRQTRNQIALAKEELLTL